MTATSRGDTCDVVVLGAGIAGLSAAYELAQRDVVVLEERDRLGGRTLSGGDDLAWYNVGAQLISSVRLLDLSRQLGLDPISLRDADFGYVVDGKFARGSSPERLLLGMNLSWIDKADFGLAAFRLRRKLHSVETMSPEQRANLDSISLQDVIGRVSPRTSRLLSECCENAAGIAASGASGLFGLAYGLGAFLDPRAKEILYSIRGGTQRVAAALAEQLPAGALRLSSRVTSVKLTAERVVVTYVSAEDEERTLTAAQCVCALPAQPVLEVVEDLPADKEGALRRVTPYSSLISIAWPVADRRPAPWDGVFTCPVSGPEGFNLLTNYGYLTKRKNPELGGYLNTLSAGAKADLFEAVPDDAMLDRIFGELVAIFPAARSVLDRDGAIVQRWERGGLPAVRPGYLADREPLRKSHDRIHFCGDYTSEPGLPGANGSGYHAARAAAARLPNEGAAV